MHLIETTQLGYILIVPSIQLPAHKSSKLSNPWVEMCLRNDRYKKHFRESASKAFHACDLVCF